MKYIFTLYLLFAFGVNLSVNAQRKTKSVVGNADTKANISQYIQNYRFTDAIRILQREIASAKKRGESTSKLEVELHRADMGEEMLKSIEKVVFIDSIKASREHFLQELNLSSELGTIFSISDNNNLLSFDLDEIGEVGYINSLGNRLLYSLADSVGMNKNIHEAFSSNQSWSKPTILTGITNQEEEQDFPFMMPDGITLYYSAKGGNSLGGYDLFVTRYSTNEKTFLKAENLGMPFNSPANDYFLAIDENNKLGWLVTDRNQTADSVCIYVFVPSVTRQEYDTNVYSEKELVHFAQIHAINETQEETEIVEYAKKRLADYKTSILSPNERHRYIINDTIIYTDIRQFKKERARRIAQQIDEVTDQLELAQKEQDKLQLNISKGIHKDGDKDRLGQLNHEIPRLRKQYKLLSKNMRKAEIGQ